MIIRNNRNCRNDALTVDVPRQTSFHLPQGTYGAVITSLRPDTRQSQSGGVPMLRMYFEVQVPQLSQFRCVAKLDIRRELNEGSDLWNLIGRLLGRRCLESASGGQFNLLTLIGTPCDIELSHVHDENCEHPHPLVIVTDVQPAGNLIKKEQV
jgi:hypothetical protein